AQRAETEPDQFWFADQMVPNLLGETTRARRPEVVDRVRALIGAQDGRGIAWAQRAMAARPDSGDALRDAQLPGLVITGAEDTMMSAEITGALAEQMSANHVSIPGAGHLPPVETPREFTAAVANW